MQYWQSPPGLANWSDRRGGDVAQLVMASERRAADAGSIPQCGEGFSAKSQLSVQTLLRCPHPPVCNGMH